MVMTKLAGHELFIMCFVLYFSVCVCGGAVFVLFFSYLSRLSVESAGNKREWPHPGHTTHILFNFIVALALTEAVST